MDVELLDADAVRRLCPYLRTDDLLGATYSPRDGDADPYLCTTAIAARARKLGAEIRQQCEVHGFTRRGAGHGFMHGPITGQLMAELIAHSRAVTMDPPAGTA